MFIIPLQPRTTKQLVKQNKMATLGVPPQLLLHFSIVATLKKFLLVPKAADAQAPEPGQHISRSASEPGQTAAISLHPAL